MQLTKKKTAIMALALILCVGMVSAGLLSYYAKIETTVSVTQGILVDGQGYETPITEEVPAPVGGGTFYTVHSIQNLGDKEATVYLSWESNDSKGIDVEYFVNIATLTLENKDPDTWQAKPDKTNATLTYCIIGNEFGYKLEAFGLAPNTEYSLIYYADKYPNRFDPSQFGGDNPGALIVEGTTTSLGYLLVSGSTELNMDLPSYPDANIDKYDYSVPPDNYAHPHGAKIWLVPSLDYNGVDKLTAWHPENYLFETDLISYIDLDSVSTHLLHPDPEIVTVITIPAHSTVSFVIRFDFASEAIGTYLVTTTISPTE
jgi:hypothetical protein